MTDAHFAVGRIRKVVPLDERGGGVKRINFLDHWGKEVPLGERGGWGQTPHFEVGERGYPSVRGRERGPRNSEEQFQTESTNSSSSSNEAADSRGEPPSRFT